MRQRVTFQNKGGPFHLVVFCFIGPFPLLKSVAMTFSELADFYISIQGKRRKIEKAIGYIPSSLKGIWVKWRKGKGQFRNIFHD